MTAKIINNSAADCPILLKFTTDHVYAAPDVPQTFKVKGSKIKVTAITLQP